jgi:hypothetical protein
MVSTLIGWSAEAEFARADRFFLPQFLRPEKRISVILSEAKNLSLRLEFNPERDSSLRSE